MMKIRTLFEGRVSCILLPVRPGVFRTKSHDFYTAFCRKMHVNG